MAPSCIPGLIEEERVDSFDVIDGDFGGFSLPGDESRGGNELDGVSQTRLHADSRQDRQRIVRHLHVFLLATNLQNLSGKRMDRKR